MIIYSDPSSVFPMLAPVYVEFAERHNRQNFIPVYFQM